MKRYLQIFLLAVGFDLYWFLVVFFRERGLVLWLGIAILALMMLPPARRLYCAIAGGGGQLSGCALGADGAD